MGLFHSWVSPKPSGGNSSLYPPLRDLMPGARSVTDRACVRREMDRADRALHLPGHCRPHPAQGYAVKLSVRMDAESV